MAARWMRLPGSPLHRDAVQSHSLPDLTPHLEITRRNRRAIRDIPANANQCLKKLEKEGLLRLEYGVTIVDLSGCEAMASS